MSRTIELSDEDCERIEEYWDHSIGLPGRIYDIVVTARPPEPRSITIDGVTPTEDDAGQWHYKNGLVAAWSHSYVAKAFVRIWELEQEADRG